MKLRKLIALISALLMLCTMLPVGAITVTAEESSRILMEIGTWSDYSCSKHSYEDCPCMESCSYCGQANPSVVDHQFDSILCDGICNLCQQVIYPNRNHRFEAGKCLGCGEPCPCTDVVDYRCTQCGLYFPIPEGIATAPESMYLYMGNNSGTVNFCDAEGNKLVENAPMTKVAGRLYRLDNVPADATSFQLVLSGGVAFIKNYRYRPFSAEGYTLYNYDTGAWSAYLNENCTHEGGWTYKDGVCTLCGFQCEHSGGDICSVCGHEAERRLYVDISTFGTGKVTFYAGAMIHSGTVGEGQLTMVSETGTIGWIAIPEGATHFIAANKTGVVTVQAVAISNTDNLYTMTSGSSGTWSQFCPEHSYVDIPCMESCSRCGAANPQIEKHTYEEAPCAESCSRCGAANPQIEKHTYEEAPCTESCTYCGEANPSIGDHQFDDDVCDGICNLCQQVIYPERGHILDERRSTPDMSERECWDEEVSGYWHCGVCDTYFRDKDMTQSFNPWDYEGIVRGEIHTYDDCFDLVCNDCDYERTEAEVEHDYGGDCNELVCWVCGHERTEEEVPLEEHDFGWCGELACYMCGHERTPEQVPLEEHNFEGWCYELVCLDCGAYERSPEQIPLEDHYFGESGCEAVCHFCDAENTDPWHSYSGICDSTCNGCGYVRERFLPHSPSYINSGEPISCIWGVLKPHWYCDLCDGFAWDEAFTQPIDGVPEEQIYAPHTYDGEGDYQCNLCLNWDTSNAPVAFDGFSVSEDVSGLAFKFSLGSTGVTVKNSCEAVWDNAYLGQHKIVNMYALVYNAVQGSPIVRLPIERLYELNEDGSCTFVVRVIEIPEHAYDELVFCELYVDIEDTTTGMETTIILPVMKNTYNNVLNGVE